MHRLSWRFIALAVAAALFQCARAQASPVPYAFTLQPPSGAAFSNASTTAHTSGTLIGNWDPIDNPTGTRTKPGLFGTFGDNENLPVNTAIAFSAGGPLSFPLGGAFDLQLDTAASTLLLQNFVSMLISHPSGGLPVSAAISFESFRTRNPSSTYPGVPITLPLGDATLTALSLTQADPGAPGALVPQGPGVYSFTVAPVVSVFGTLDLEGTELPLGPILTPLPMQGTITLSGDQATLTSLAPIDVSDTSTPGIVLPPIPFDLPTVLPAGDVAHLIFHLTLDQIVTTLQGQINLDATGAVVPEPSAAAAALLPLVLARRLRRRARA